MIILNRMLTAAFLLSFFPSLSHCEPYAASFLRIRNSARAAALGGAACAMRGDLGAIEHNPAGLVGLRGLQAGLVYTQWFESLIGNYAALGYGTEYGGFAVSWYTLTSADIIRRDISGNDQDSFRARYGTLSAALARRVAEHVVLGFGFKQVTEAMDNHSAAALTLDGGMQVTVDRTILGLSILNFGQGMALLEERFDLPLTLSAGIWHRLSRRVRLTACLDSIRLKDMEPRAGLEIETRPRRYPDGKLSSFSFRGGYAIPARKTAADGFSAGVGYRYGWMTIDYAYVPFGELGTTNRFELLVRL